MDDFENGRQRSDLEMMSKIDLEESTPIADQVSLGCTQRESETSNRIVMDKSQLCNKLVCIIQYKRNP